MNSQRLQKQRDAVNVQQKPFETSKAYSVSTPLIVTKQLDCRLHIFSYTIPDIRLYKPLNNI